MNRRLEQAHLDRLVKLGMQVGSGRFPVSWVTCKSHLVMHPPDDVCSVCAPVDPSHPANNMPVIDDVGNKGVIYRVGTNTFDVLPFNYPLVTTPNNQWLKTVFPDFTDKSYWQLGAGIVTVGVAAHSATAGQTVKINVQGGGGGGGGSSINGPQGAQGATVVIDDHNLGTRYPKLNPILPNHACCDCSYPNPYPDDNYANCDKGWRCSQCRIIRSMQ